jgi:hypothetical protein
MCDIRIDYLARAFRPGHSHRILSFMDDKFEPPQSISRRAKSATNRRSLGIAQKSELVGKEKVEHVFRGVS